VAWLHNIRREEYLQAVSKSRDSQTGILARNERSSHDNVHDRSLARWLECPHAKLSTEIPVLSDIRRRTDVDVGNVVSDGSVYGQTVDMA